MAELSPQTNADPFEMLIELGKVREFARATKATSASYWSESAPIAPPTFLITSELWTEARHSVLRGLGLAWSRLLSGGTEFLFDGPPLRSGEHLRAQQQLNAIYPKEGRRGGPMRFIEFSTRFLRSDGTLAATERHLTIETQNPVIGAGVRADARAPGSLTDTMASRPRALARPASEMTRGDSLPSLVDYPVTRTDIVRYQGASGDLNPIHHDDAVARAAGYDRVFSVGMLHAGVMGSYLADLFGPGSLRRFKVEFRGQVWPGEVLTYDGVVASETKKSTSSNELLLDLSARLPDGRLHLNGAATVVV